MGLVAAARDVWLLWCRLAGTPLISDPGYKLVREAREAGVAVYTRRGRARRLRRCRFAGCDRPFLLHGLADKAKARSDALAELSNVKATLVFYESRHGLQRRWQAMPMPMATAKWQWRAAHQKFEEWSRKPPPSWPSAMRCRAEKRDRSHCRAADR